MNDMLEKSFIVSLRIKSLSYLPEVINRTEQIATFVNVHEEELVTFTLPVKERARPQPITRHRSSNGTTIEQYSNHLVASGLEKDNAVITSESVRQWCKNNKFNPKTASSMLNALGKANVVERIGEGRYKVKSQKLWTLPPKKVSAR
jgi:hypothetical protein